MPSVVIFTENNARILKVADAASYEKMPNAVVNPDFSAVKGIAPHYWKHEAGRIVPMSEFERAARDRDHAERGVINIFDAPKRSLVQRIKHDYYNALLAFGVLGLGFLAGFAVGVISVK